MHMHTVYVKVQRSTDCSCREKIMSHFTAFCLAALRISSAASRRPSPSSSSVVYSTNEVYYLYSNCSCVPRVPKNAGKVPAGA